MADKTSDSYKTNRDSLMLRGEGQAQTNIYFDSVAIPTTSVGVALIARPNDRSIP